MHSLLFRLSFILRGSLGGWDRMRGADSATRKPRKAAVSSVAFTVFPYRVHDEISSGLHLFLHYCLRHWLASEGPAVVLQEPAVAV